MTPRFALGDLATAPNGLAPHYSRFRVTERLLLTGHSHQAWPDCGFEGQKAAWLDAAELVDRKWERAFEQAERVRDGYRRLMDDADADITLGASTHELIVRFLSALPLRQRPKLVTTRGEFHSLRRQLDRLAEEGIEIVRVPADPAETVTERVASEIDDRTAAALVSAVYFRNAHIVPNLRSVQDACTRVGAAFLVDTYHALNATTFSIREQGLDAAFVTGGGYKYCQLGEGVCFLRVPGGFPHTPVVTGWFAEFEDLSHGTGTERVRYGRGAAAFTGATYDPTSHYRAARVFDFFAENDLTPAFLREVSQHQVGLLASSFDALGIDPRLVTRNRETPLAGIGGFLALDTPLAQELHAGLAARGVLTDWRDDILRFGPAPYLSDTQLRDAMAALGEVAARIG